MNSASPKSLGSRGVLVTYGASPGAGGAGAVSGAGAAGPLLSPGHQNPPGGGNVSAATAAVVVDMSGGAPVSVSVSAPGQGPGPGSSINFLGTQMPPSTVMSGANAVDAYDLGAGAPPGSHLPPDELDNFRLLDAAETLVNLQSMQDQQQQEQQQQQQQSSQPQLPPQSLIESSGQVIYLSTSPSSSSTTALQISPLSSPILHQLAPPTTQQTQTFLEEGKPASSSFVQPHEQLELRGVNHLDQSGGSGELDLRSLSARRLPDDSFDLSLPSGVPSSSSSAPMGPPANSPQSSTFLAAHEVTRQRLAVIPEHKGTANYIVHHQHQQPQSKSPASEMMKPPPAPPPTSGRRGRGRGRGRGGAGGVGPAVPDVHILDPGLSAGRGAAGRGRGRGRGSRAVAAAAASQPSAVPVPRPPPQQQQQQPPPQPPPVLGKDYGDVPGVEAPESSAGEPSKPGAEGQSTGATTRKDEDTFQIGHLTVSNSLFNQLLNQKKLELFQDPEVLQFIRSAQGRTWSEKRRGHFHHGSKK